MHLSCNSGFKYERHIIVIGMNMSDGQRGLDPMQAAYFAYSIRDSVTFGEPFFFIMRMFRGGEGHCNDIKSLVGVPAQVSEVLMEELRLT